MGQMRDFRSKMSEKKAIQRQGEKKPETLGVPVATPKVKPPPQKAKTKGPRKKSRRLALKFHLPSGSSFQAAYNKKGRTWSGTLTVPNKQDGTSETFQGVADGIHLLFSDLGWLWYSKSHPGAERPEVPEEVEAGTDEVEATE